MDTALAALAEPTRRTLFEIVRAEPGITTSQLSARVKRMSRWGVMKHLSVLRGAGLVHTMATGRQRRHYAETAPLAAARAWFEKVAG